MLLCHTVLDERWCAQLLMLSRLNHIALQVYKAAGD